MNWEGRTSGWSGKVGVVSLASLCVSVSFLSMSIHNQISGVWYVNASTSFPPFSDLLLDRLSCSGSLRSQMGVQSESLQDCVCYGLGSFSMCVSARYQLALLLLLLDTLKVGFSNSNDVWQRILRKCLACTSHEYACIRVFLKLFHGVYYKTAKHIMEKHYLKPCCKVMLFKSSFQQLTTLIIAKEVLL